MTTHKKISRRQHRMHDWSNYLSNEPTSPCFECIIKAVCTKSFIDKTACEKLSMFVDDCIKIAKDTGTQSNSK